MAPHGDTLVVIFLRGAADALNMVVLYGEETYYARSPTLAIPRPDDRHSSADLRTVDLNGFFGLHPALRPLLAAWQAEHLAVIHACGTPDDSRSHFQAMTLMERGVASESGPASGWIGRHLATHHTGKLSPLRAVGFGNPVPRSLRGPVPAATLKSISDFHLGGDPRALAAMQHALAAFHADLHAQAGRWSVVVMSEFGRRLQENGSFGTDHGHGGALLLLGGNVVGGRVHGRWPGLSADQLVGPGDLAVTTDYRDVLGEVCVQRLGNRQVEEVFPGWLVQGLGVVR